MFFFPKKGRKFLYDYFSYAGTNCKTKTIVKIKDREIIGKKLYVY